MNIDWKIELIIEFKFRYESLGLNFIKFRYISEFKIEVRGTKFLWIWKWIRLTSFKFGWISEITSFWYHFSTKQEVEYHKTCFFGVLGEYWPGPRGTGIAKFYSSGNRGVKKWPGPQGTGSSKIYSSGNWGVKKWPIPREV